MTQKQKERIYFRLLNDELKVEWNKYVTSSSSACYIHHIAWKETIENTYGHKPYYLMAFENEKVVGVLPMFLISIPLLGKILASGVFGSYGGICADNSDIANFLMTEAADLSRSLNVKYLEIKNFNNFSQENKGWEKYYNYYTFIIKLDKNPDLVLNKLTKKARQNIRKAVRSNIKIVKGSRYLEAFYDLIANNMKRLGTPVHSKKFYKSILKKFNGDAELYIAKFEDRTVSVALTIKYNSNIFGYANAAHPDYLSYKANFLIYWEIIKSAGGSELKYFDLGRSINNSGTFNFKQNFGASPLPLYYDYYMNKVKNIPVINSESKILSPAAQLWSHLPLGVTKKLGPHLIKYVA